MSVDLPILKLMHTADVHIGDDYDPARRLHGFTRVVDAAIEHHAHAVLIVGDFFDNARIQNHDILSTLEQLSRLSIPTIITTGNHDQLDGNSIYHRVPLSEAGPHVYFMDNPAGTHLIFDDLHLSIWCRTMVDHHPGHFPLGGYSLHPESAGHWRVVMAHGHFVPENERTDRSSPIPEGAIGELDAHFVALGHWHRFLDCSANGVPAFYPGSPSEPGGSFASTNLVTMDSAAGVRVERIATG